MKLRVYNWEYFERKTRRYIVFLILLTALVIASFVYENQVWGLFILILAGGYYYTQTKVALPVDMELQENGIKIRERMLLFTNMLWFVLEGDPQTGKVHNIVFLLQSGSEIFTVHDDEQNIVSFVQLLSEKIPISESYQQSFIEKLIRKLKL